MVQKDTPQPTSQGDIVDIVGGNGPWQRIIFVVAAIFGMPLSAQNLVMTFYAPNLDHWCSRPEGSNWTLGDWKNYGLPQQDQKCSRYDVFNITDHSNNSDSSIFKVIQCNSWEYDETLYGSTLLSKWNLVCDREWLVSLSKSIFICGYMFSVMLFGYLADKYGRKPIISLCNIIGVVFSIICAFSTSFLMFAVCRFFIAVGLGGCYITSFVLVMEVLGPKYRACIGVGICYGWCFGYALLPLIVWLIKDWFWIQLVLTIPSVLLLFSWWILPESPRWLLTKGEKEKALRVLLAAGKRNGLILSDFHDELKRAISKTKGYEVKQSYRTILHLIMISGMWKRALVMFYLWFITAFVYYGVSYNTNELAGDPYINFAASGVIEFPAYTIALLVVGYLGRKWPQGATLSGAAIACFLMLIVPEDPWWLGVAMTMIGKLCIASSFGILYVYASEIFPTSVRALSLGSASMSARVGSIIAPFVRELSHATHPAVPQVIFGTFALVGGALVAFLPETKNVTVPNTFAEAAEVKKKEEQNTIETNESIL